LVGLEFLDEADEGEVDVEVVGGAEGVRFYHQLFKLCRHQHLFKLKIKFGMLIKASISKHAILRLNHSQKLHISHLNRKISLHLQRRNLSPRLLNLPL
jgi:hypothetical protein